MSEKKRTKHRVIIGCCDDHHGVIDELKAVARHRLGERGNVVMTRLNDTDFEKIDALVEVEVFQSRSEAAAFFIKEGIQARNDLIERVMPTVDKIRELRQQVKQSLGQVGEPESPEGKGADLRIED